MKFTSYRGIAALPTLLVLGGVVVNIMIVLTVGVYLLSTSGLGSRLSSEALAAAYAGVQDGLIRLARDNNNFPTSYQFSVNTANVTVEICTTLPECGGVGNRKISSTGTALTRSRKVEAIVSVSAFGEVSLESIKELPL
ncbi:MAG TPA: hypothetical protein VJH70_00355 [Candidatus Paceibacterota bacterium]